MNKFVFGVAVCLIAMGAQNAALRAQAQNSDELQIRTLEKNFAAAVKAKDLDAVMNVYAPGNQLLVFDLSVPRQYAGWDAYKKDWQGVFAMFSGPIEFEIQDLAVTNDGKLAFSHSIQHVKGVGADGKPIDLIVRVTDDYRKIDGKWLIVTEHVSVPIDMQTGQPDMMSKP